VSSKVLFLNIKIFRVAVRVYTKNLYFQKQFSARATEQIYLIFKNHSSDVP
jgi:hypothetical protein